MKPGQNQKALEQHPIALSPARNMTGSSAAGSGVVSSLRPKGRCLSASQTGQRNEVPFGMCFTDESTAK